MKITIFNTILLTCFLSGCANQASQFIIAPELGAIHSNIYQEQQIKLKVIDIRPGTHIAQILSSNEAAKLYSSKNTLDGVINNVMDKQLKAQGLKLTNESQNAIEIRIDNALITVELALIKYNATSKITLRFIINNGEKTLTKTFRSTTTSNGPFS